MSYEPYSITVDPADTAFDDLQLASVTPASDKSGWSVSSEDGVGCFVPRLVERVMVGAGHVTPEPQPGDTLRVYGLLGMPMQGQVLNGHVIWYRTPEEREVHRQRQLEDYAAARRRRFDVERAALDAQYDDLPAPFRKRIDRFRSAKPDFRIDSESYEMFCLAQAALLAAHFGTEEAVRAWNAIRSYDEQMRQAPPGWSDEHSGNTAGAAVALACAVLRGEQV